MSALLLLLLLLLLLTPAATKKKKVVTEIPANSPPLPVFFPQLSFSLSVLLFSPISVPDLPRWLLRRERADFKFSSPPWLPPLLVLVLYPTTNAVVCKMEARSECLHVA